MAPKKSKKISLNEFLGDSTLGSWADEMDSLPNAPAARVDEEQGQRFARRDDSSSIRQDRHIREDIPLPMQPPYTAFIGNLAFDLTETELGQFFSSSKIKSVKIIKDKDDKPKGFGYVEFEDLDGLKDALAKTGSNFSGRVVRVSVAEPPKERSGHAGLSDDSKFESPWRRDGPLPARDSSRRRYEADRQGASVADEMNDWRSNRPQRVSESEQPSFKRKGSGFPTSETHVNVADKEDNWSMGSKFRPSSDASHEESVGKFGSIRGKNDMGPPKELPRDEADWRRARPPHSSVSPNSSTPPTPQLTRRKLELLPRSGSTSVTPSPLSSPKMGPTPTSGNSRPNPFGAAKPVDVSSREREVAGRLEREKEAQQEKHTMSRTSSRTGIERNPTARAQTPPSASPGAQSKLPPSKPMIPNLAPTVRPSLSFANVAAKKDQPVTKLDDGEIETDATVPQVSSDM